MIARAIPLYAVHLPPCGELMPALEKVLYSGQISEGQPVRDFEAAFAAHFRLPPCLSFYSATAALHTALILAGVGNDVEVVSTPVTTEPTNMAILHAGGRIVWADVDPLSGNIAPESVAERLSARTRAIMAVHYAGVPVDLARLSEVATNAGVPVIEDAAHALGASFGGRPIGGHSDFVVFSFQAIKHLTTVDGGMLVCRAESARRRGKLVRWFGIDRERSRMEQDVTEIGFKYHMNNVNATIGLVQLGTIDAVLERHRANGRFFDQALAQIPGLSIIRRDPAATPAWWTYLLLAENRDGLLRKLNEHGVMASTSIRRNDAHTVFAASRRALPGVERFMAAMLHLPCGWWVTDEDRERIADIMRRGW